jgi:hypothetical protein
MYDATGDGKAQVRDRQERVDLHQVSNQADHRLREGLQVIVELRLLVSDVAQPECPLCAGEPGLRVGGPER